jgi:protein involved in polysaccharide export with SLBB domain
VTHSTRPGRFDAILRAAVLVALLGLLTTPLGAQTSPWEYRGLEMSREALQEVLAQYEAVAASSVYTDRLREEAVANAAQIRERLEEGDFRAGDRIVLQMLAGNDNADTVVVEPGAEIVLPNIGSISLQGVLRSELQAHLERELGRFIRAPKIRTVSLIRLAISGMVGRPGFYVVPATTLLEEVIMQAGGPGQASDLDRVEIDRNGVVLMSGFEVRTALTDGRSVDQLNLRAGDQITVPMRPVGSVWKTIGRYALIIGAPLLLGIRIF